MTTTASVSHVACVNCIFYEAIAAVQGLSGECRRYPPRPMTRNSVFPVVNDNDYCGEFVPRAAGQEVQEAPAPEPQRLRQTWE